MVSEIGAPFCATQHRIFYPNPGGFKISLPHHLRIVLGKRHSCVKVPTEPSPVIHAHQCRELLIKQAQIRSILPLRFRTCPLRHTAPGAQPPAGIVHPPSGFALQHCPIRAVEQKSPLAQRNQIPHRSDRLHNLIQQLPALGRYGVPVGLGSCFFLIRPSWQRKPENPHPASAASDPGRRSPG